MDVIALLIVIIQTIALGHIMGSKCFYLQEVMIFRFSSEKSFHVTDVYEDVTDVTLLIGSNDFSFQFSKIITRYRYIAYNLNVILAAVYMLSF